MKLILKHCSVLVCYCFSWIPIHTNYGSWKWAGTSCRPWACNTH